MNEQLTTPMVLLGFIAVFLSGFICGLAPFPIKFMRRFQYEHWGLLSSFLAFLAIPAAALFAICPDLPGALADMPARPLLVANLFSLAWGVANVLYLICLVKIGFSLGNGILLGIAIPMGVVIPMAIKGSGVFASAPAIGSLAGVVICTGVVVMVVSVAMISMAGFGKERSLSGNGVSVNGRGGFAAGLAMSVAAGILCIGISFSFVYTQDPIGRVFAAHGVAERDIPTAVRIVTLMGGTAANLAYPLVLLFRNRSWGVFLGEGAWREALLAVPFAVLTILSFAIGSSGQIMMGALGSSVGFGVSQATQILSSQCVGLASGEWRGVATRYRRLMVAALALMLVGIAVSSAGQAIRQREGRAGTLPRPEVAGDATDISDH